jgi:hypothetical protein
METPFYCSSELYEYLGIHIRLTNAHKSFQDMMNHNLEYLLDKYIFGYLDNILIYPKNSAQNIKLIEEVLGRLAKNELVISCEK